MYNASNGTLKLGKRYNTNPVRLVWKQQKFSVYTGGGAGSRQVIFIFNTISRAIDVQFFNVFISIDLSFHKLSNAVFEEKDKKGPDNAQIPPKNDD